MKLSDRRLWLAGALVALAGVIVSVAIAAAPTFTSSSTPTSITLSPLVCATKYRIRLQSYNANGRLSPVTDQNASTADCPTTTTTTPTTTPTTTTTPTPPPDTAPAPISGQGYTKVWGDEFDTFTPGTWSDGIWYDPGNPAGSTYVQDGVLNLVSKRSTGYQNVTVSTEAGASPKTFTLGYFEARMRWTKGAGAWPAFWLLSYRHAVNDAWPAINPYCAQNGLPAALCYSAELDVFEGQGSEPNVFYGTVHRNSSEDYGVPDSQNDNNYQDVGVDLAADFHTYGMLWTTTTISWYLDGKFPSWTKVCVEQDAILGYRFASCDGPSRRLRKGLGDASR
jgi:beta-glucanase (GH16 family)